MADDLARRGFLRGLATLPLIGGAVSIIGTPVRADVPVTPDLLEAYKTWLDMEHRFLTWGMSRNPEVCARYGFREDADPRERWDAIRNHCHAGYYCPNEAHPETRAAAVLATVGHDLTWRART